MVPAVGHLRPSHIREESIKRRLPGPEAFIPLLPEELVVLGRRGVPDAGADLGATGLYLEADWVKSSSPLRRHTYQNPAPPSKKVDKTGQDHPAVALLVITLRDAPYKARTITDRGN